MIKRIFAVILCMIMVVSVFASCAKKSENDKGAIINMYLSQEVYDFDPAYAYNNDAALKIVDLIFATLFEIDENGKLKKELASGYEIDEAHNRLIVSIKENASWSDGTYVSANDVVYTIKRVLAPEFSSEVASLLFDIKNARTVKNATSDYYLDDIGVYAIGERDVEFTFEEGFTDYEGFLYNLASPALAPLREDLVAINEGDWAKKPGTMACSGPFMIRKISYEDEDKGITLERNPYYFRVKDQKIDKSVTPYRIIVDYTKTAEEQYQMYLNGELFYIGDIALSLRSGDIKKLKLEDALSTATIYMNQNAYIGKNFRTLDHEVTKDPDRKEDVETGIVTIKTVHIMYYTYYNHMSAEDYAAKYETEYVEIPIEDKPATPAAYANYTQGNYSTRRVEVVDGVTTIYIDEYQEWRYKAEVVGEDGKKYATGIVDIPDGVKLFADKNIRKALSLVIDREAIANKVVYAKAATALVPGGIFNIDYKRNTDFRKEGGSIIGTGADLAAAQALIPSSVNPADFEIELAVRANDEVHIAIAEEIEKAWESLGFRVVVNPIRSAINDDMGSTGQASEDIRDDIFTENYETGNYNALIIDLVAPTTSAFSILAPFATEFAGTSIDMNPNDGDIEHLYEIMGHRTGYENKEYDEKIEAAFAAADKKEKAALLHEAEKILLEDMPVIPIVFNQDAYVVSSELTSVKSTYFNTRIFTKSKLKSWDYAEYALENGLEP